MSILALAELEKITSIRDSTMLEHALLRTIGSTLEVESLTMWMLESENEVSRAVHYKRNEQADQDAAGQIVTEYDGIEIPADVRELARQVRETGQFCRCEVEGGEMGVFPLRGSAGMVAMVSMICRDKHISHAVMVVQSVLGVYSNYHSLLDESQRDRLTGLYNRHAMDLNIDRMWAMLGSDANSDDEAERRNVDAPVHVLALVDIDHFKRVNDTYGHVMGDEILLLVARQISGCFRKRDVVCRYGGEEFLVMAAVDKLESAAALFERVRLGIEKKEFPQVGKVTVSIGYSAVNVIRSPSENIGRSDRALYYAKEHGRNQVHSFDRLLETGEMVDADYGSTELF